MTEKKGERQRKFHLRSFDSQINFFYLFFKQDLFLLGATAIEDKLQEVSSPKV